MKYAALFLLAFALGSGWTLGVYIAAAIWTVGKNTVKQLRKRPRTFRK